MAKINLPVDNYDVKEYDKEQTQAINENTERFKDYLEKEDTGLFRMRGFATNANIGEGAIGNSGWYSCGAGSQNLPFEYGTLVHFDRDGVSKAQIFIEISTAKMYTRSRSSAGVWSSWRAV